MKENYFLKYLVFISGVLSATAVHAGQPVAFDGWQSNNGIIDASASCRQAISCRTVVQENGFLQQEIMTAEGRFIRQIIVDKGATGSASTLAFATETMIPVGQGRNRRNGNSSNAMSSGNIDTKQIINDASSGFSSTSLIERHAFTDNQHNSGNYQRTELYQAINDQQVVSVFSLNQTLVDYLDQTSRRSRELNIDQLLKNIDDAESNVQVFALRERQGFEMSFYDVVDNTITKPLSYAGTAVLGTQTLEWSDGDHIKGVFIGQKNPLNTGAGFMFQSIETIDKTGLTTRKISDVKIDTPEIIDPYQWERNFAKAPYLPILSP